MKQGTKGAFQSDMKSRKLTSKKPAVVYTIAKKIAMTPDMVKVLKFIRSQGNSSENQQDQPSIFA
jgi:hypothetical protein